MVVSFIIQQSICNVLFDEYQLTVAFVKTVKHSVELGPGAMASISNNYVIILTKNAIHFFF